MSRQYIEENLRKLTKSDLINIIREMTNEEKSYNAALEYERQRYKELDEEVKELREQVKTSCSETEFAIIKAIRNHLAEAASYIGEQIDNAIEEHNEHYHYYK